MKILKSICMVAFVVIVIFLDSSAHADLTLLGQGTSVQGTYNLIYDTDLDVTWYDFNNKVGPSTVQPQYGTWQDQIDWASALTVNFSGAILDNWRLPSALNSDNTGPCWGHNCTDSEMGHLYYIELGNSANLNGSINTGVFQNFPQYNSWSGTEVVGNPNNAWYFEAQNGLQDNNYKNGTNDAIAVMEGMAVVPEPISFILFVTGGGLLAGRRLIIKKIRT